MSLSATSIGTLLRRNYPRAEGVIKQIIEAIQFSRTQGTRINEFDIINRVILLRSKVKVDDEETTAQIDVSGGYPTYIPATEPDGDKVKLYLLLDHLSDKQYTDHSGFGNHAYLQYENSTPEVDIDGPDLGNGHPSRALKFDSTKHTVLVVKDAPNIRINGLTTGFSLTIRFRLSSLANQGGTMRRLYVKRDDSNYSIIIGVNSTGRLEIHVEFANVTTRWETTNAEITANDWYTATIVYAVTGPALTVYITKDGDTAGAAKALTSGIASRTIFDETADLLVGGYDNGAYGTFDGSTSRSTTHSAPLSLTTFSVAAKFQTGKDYTGTFAYIMVKGNYVTETAGQNINYLIGMNNLNKISAGFETSAGTDTFVESPKKYNDGIWHYAVCTFDGSTLRLYIDGILVKSLATTNVPDTNTLSLFIGAHQGPTNFWTGGIDEVRVWNTVLNQTDVTNLLTDNIQQTGLVFEENFDADGFHFGGFADGNIQWIMFERDILYTSGQAQAIHNNKWTKNPDVGSNKVATVFLTLATTP
jgi:hypothetical protein